MADDHVESKASPAEKTDFDSDEGTIAGLHDDDLSRKLHHVRTEMRLEMEGNVRGEATKDGNDEESTVPNFIAQTGMEIKRIVEEGRSKRRKRVAAARSDRRDVEATAREVLRLMGKLKGREVISISSLAGAFEGRKALLHRAVKHLLADEKIMRDLARKRAGYRISDGVIPPE